MSAQRMDIATLTQYLRWPMRSALLLLIISFALLLTLGEQAGLLGIPLYLILASWFFKYSFVLVDHVLDGRSEPPVLSIEMVNPFEQRPLGTLLIAAGYYLLTAALETKIGAQNVLALRIAGLAILPAMLATMSITGSFVDALKPWLVLTLIKRIAAPYAILLLLLALLWLAPILLFKLTGLDAMTSGVLSKIFFMYLWLTMMCCIGGVMYEHRDSLGIEPSITPERQAARIQTEMDREHDLFIDRLFAQCRSGTFDKAIATVQTLLNQSAQPLNEFRWLYARTAQWPDKRLAARLVQLCLPALLKERHYSETLDRVRERLRDSQTFRPDTADQVLTLVRIARDGGDRATARLLLIDHRQFYPADPLAPMLDRLAEELRR
ncbi:MAG: hypothetical protein QM808_05675 [Steroidobacteraceae bacterium]